MNEVANEQLTQRRVNNEVSGVSEVDQAQSTIEQHGKLVLSGKAFHLDGAQPLDVMSFPNPPRKESSPPPATIPNVAHLLDKYSIQVRYDVIKKKVLITLPGHSGTVDNLDNVAMTQINSLTTLNGIPISQVPAIVEALADRNMYNPVVEWITSKPWDGKNRLPEIYATVTEQQDYPVHLKEILMYKWLLSSVAAVLKHSGFKARGVLTFQGPQGVGKTSWLRSLVPDELLCEMTVKIDHHLDVSNKDTILGAVSHWLVEIGELDSSFRKDVARLKGFLTSDYDKIRRPYARTESEYQRRTVFFASVNQPDFLVDMTGNSRWWTIPVIEINYRHGIDMQQLFAQLAEDFHQGKQWWLDQHEEALLDSCNRHHLSTSVIREHTLKVVDLELKGKDGNPAMSASEVLKMFDYKNPTNPQCRECGAILRELIGEPKKIQGIQKWRIPLRPPTDDYTPINHTEDDDY